MNSRDFPDGPGVGSPAWVQGTWMKAPATHSILAGKISWTEEPGRSQSRGSHSH